MGIGHLANLTCETIVCPRCSKHNRIGPSRGLISQVKSRFSQTQCPIWLWPDLARKAEQYVACYWFNCVRFSLLVLYRHRALLLARTVPTLSSIPINGSSFRSIGKKIHLAALWVSC